MRVRAYGGTAGLHSTKDGFGGGRGSVLGALAGQRLAAGNADDWLAAGKTGP